MTAATSDSRTPSPARLDVLVLGDARHPDLTTTWRTLATDNVAYCQDVAAAHRRLEQATAAPQLIVLCQPRPGVFSAGEVARLRRLAPLAGIAAVLGSWCAGEQRTGRPPPGVWRVRADELAGWLAQGRAALAAGGTPVWAWPATLSAPEQTLLEPTPSRVLAGRTAGVIARTATAFGAVEQAVRVLGGAAVWRRGRQTPPTPVAVVVLDLERADDGYWSDVAAELPEAWSAAPRVALVGFPRSGDVERLRRDGVARVLGKPYWLRDLAQAVGEALDPAPK